MDNVMTPPEGQKLADQHLAQLMEHFDHVQIIASWASDSGDTMHISRGRGNWFARIGQCRAWMKFQEDSELADEIADRLDDDDENWKGA